MSAISMISMFQPGFNYPKIRPVALSKRRFLNKGARLFDPVLLGCNCDYEPIGLPLAA